MRRAKDRIAQSKRVRAGSLAIVDYSHKWHELVSSGRFFFFWFADAVLPFSAVTCSFYLFCFASFSSICFH